MPSEREVRISVAGVSIGGDDPPHPAKSETAPMLRAKRTKILICDTSEKLKGRHRCSPAGVSFILTRDAEAPARTISPGETRPEEASPLKGGAHER
jgi:hypothetical protein